MSEIPLNGTAVAASGLLLPLLVEGVISLFLVLLWMQGCKRIRLWNRQNRPWRRFRILAHRQGLQHREISYLLYLAQANAVRSPVRLLTDAERFQVLVRLALVCEGRLRMDLIRAIRQKLFPKTL